jgi:hypothetical protein
MAAHAGLWRAARTSPAAEGARTVSGFLLLVLGASFLTATMLAASIAPGYNFNAAAISDLGVIGETAVLFNALLVAVGALNIGAGVLLYRSHHRIAPTRHRRTRHARCTRYRDPPDSGEPFR